MQVKHAVVKKPVVVVVVNGNDVPVYDKRKKGTIPCPCCRGTGKAPKYVPRVFAMRNGAIDSSWETLEEALARGTSMVISSQKRVDYHDDGSCGEAKRNTEIDAEIRELSSAKKRGLKYRTELPELT